MTYEEAMAPLVALARQHNRTLTAAQAKQTERWRPNHGLVSAAARAVGGSTNVFSYDEAGDPREWFPFSGLVSQLQAADV